MQLRRAGDRNNPWLPSKQPRQRNLSRCRLLPFCDLAEQINQNLIGFASLRRKAREGVAQVGAVERSVFARHVGINAVLIEKVDHVRPKSFQRSFSNFFDVLWPAIKTDLLAFGAKL